MGLRVTKPRLGWRFWLGAALAALGAFLIGDDLTQPDPDDKKRRDR